jgi:Amidohydrolase family
LTFCDIRAVAILTPTTNAKGIYYDPTLVRYTEPYIDDVDDKNTGGKYRIIPIFLKSASMAASTKGIKVMMGGGTDGSTNPHGTQALEFEWLVKRAGLTPARAIQAGTTINAEAMGWQDRIGSIDKGKYADLIAVSDNPIGKNGHTAEDRLLSGLAQSLQTGSDSLTAALFQGNSQSLRRPLRVWLTLGSPLGHAICGPDRELRSDRVVDWAIVATETGQPDSFSVRRGWRFCYVAAVSAASDLVLAQRDRDGGEVFLKLLRVRVPTIGSTPLALTQATATWPGFAPTSWLPRGDHCNFVHVFSGDRRSRRRSLQ